MIVYEVWFANPYQRGDGYGGGETFEGGLRGELAGKG